LKKALQNRVPTSIMKIEITYSRCFQGCLTPWEQI